jgi:hypothetical protein
MIGVAYMGKLRSAGGKGVSTSRLAGFSDPYRERFRSPFRTIIRLGKVSRPPKSLRERMLIFLPPRIAPRAHHELEVDACLDRR